MNPVFSLPLFASLRASWCAATEDETPLCVAADLLQEHAVTLPELLLWYAGEPDYLSERREWDDFGRMLLSKWCEFTENDRAAPRSPDGNTYTRWHVPRGQLISWEEVLKAQGVTLPYQPNGNWTPQDREKMCRELMEAQEGSSDYTFMQMQISRDAGASPRHFREAARRARREEKRRALSLFGEVVKTVQHTFGRVELDVAREPWSYVRSMLLAAGFPDEREFWGWVAAMIEGKMPATPWNDCFCRRQMRQITFRRDIRAGDWIQPEPMYGQSRAAEAWPVWSNSPLRRETLTPPA